MAFPVESQQALLDIVRRAARHMLATLKDLGDYEASGTTWTEFTFSANHANYKFRIHVDRWGSRGEYRVRLVTSGHPRVFDGTVEELTVVTKATYAGTLGFNPDSVKATDSDVTFLLKPRRSPRQTANGVNPT